MLVYHILGSIPGFELTKRIILWKKITKWTCIMCHIIEYSLTCRSRRRENPQNSPKESPPPHQLPGDLKSPQWGDNANTAPPYLMCHIYHVNSHVNWCPVITVTVSQGRCLAPGFSKRQGFRYGFPKRPSRFWMCVSSYFPNCVCPFKDCCFLINDRVSVHCGT